MGMRARGRERGAWRTEKGKQSQNSEKSEDRRQEPDESGGEP